jgi:hypothetical protein
MKTPRSLHVAILLPVALGALPASAAEGVIELNQARALAGDPTAIPPDAPGFPIEISRPGNYRLTSDLEVPAGPNGIELLADDVHIDLGGFAIRGPEFCAPGSCSPASSGGAILHAFGAGGFRATIRNGTVTGFGGNCVQLRDGGRVDDLRVVMCGGYGIQLRSLFGDPATAFGNHITNTGLSGLVFEGGGLYRENVVLRSGLAGASPSIVGGTATGGNFCGDGLCSRRGLRRFYLTQGTADGSQASTMCSAGFHMASRFELADPSALEYDTVQGMAATDGSPGPPTTPGIGWARTATTLFPDTLGWSNCTNWSTTSGTGTVLVLSAIWGAANNGQYSPWNVGSHSCVNANPVWCIED